MCIIYVHVNTCAYITRIQMQEYNRTDLDLIDVVVGNGI